MHVSKNRNSRSRVLAWCVGVVAVCAQASSFFSCSFSTAGSLPIIPGPPQPPAPSITISVVPATITLGQSAVLSWSSIGVSACTASGAWSGPQNPAGSTKVSPTTTGTFAYVLNCSVAPAGSVAQAATLTVNALGSAGSARRLTPELHGAMVVRTDLVADIAGSSARLGDPDLIEPWGVVIPERLQAVVVSRQSDVSSSYDGVASPQPPSDRLRVDLPEGAASVAFGAMGTVANSSDGFIVSAAGGSAPARLLYAGTAGAIAAWTPEVNAGNAIIVHRASDAVYSALAIAVSSTPSESRLYAADFRNGRIEVFDSAFRKETPTPTKFAFTDPALPPGYAPFGIAVIDQLLYVAYAQRLASSSSAPATAAGLGLIDVFTLDGQFITRLVPAGGALNAPWAMVATPSGNAVPYGRALLVGNTGDGRINAFDIESGFPLGPLSDESGTALVIPSLHGLAFGNDYARQPFSTLFFTAGAGAGAHGWYGRLDFVTGSADARR